MSRQRLDVAGRPIGKRASNGPEDQGLGEDSQIVRGPRALLEAMRARARSEALSVSEAWRRAARAWLGL